MKLGIPMIFKSLNELLDRFKFQLYVLCIWKNIQIYKRNKVRLCIEILWPLLFVGIVVLMRYNYGDRAYLRQDECHFYSKPLLSAGFFEFLHGYICHFNNTCHQEYVENDNFFANQTSQLSAAFLEINKFIEEDKNATGDILIRFLTQISQYGSLKNDNKQTDKLYLKMESKGVKDKFSMGDFIKLHQFFTNILRLPKVRRVLRHFQPLLNQFQNWISGNPTLYDDDIIAIIGGMKLICGPKFYLDNEHLEKINAETFLKEMLLKPFRTQYRDMKSEFCQNLDEKIKEIPMLNKIWITIKPLFIGKLLFTPRNSATWKIMQNVNSTFERFAFYHKFTRDFINFLNVAFQKIRDIEGEAFAKHKIDILSFMSHLEMAFKISSKISEALDCLNVDRIEGFSTESELVDYARIYIDRDTFFAGVVFLDMEDNKKEGPTDNLTTILNFVRYKIRMNSQKIDPTDSLFDDDEPHSPRRHPLTHLKYYYHGFVILQELLDTAISDISSSNSIFNKLYIHKPRVTLQQIPQPCYNRDEFLRSFYWILPLQICLSWTLTIAIIILTMVEESKNHLHQYYRILGMNDTILILAQLATLLIPTFISSALTALLLFKGKILLYSDMLAIVLILFNYGLATVCLGILFGTLLRKYSLSPYIGILLYLLFTFLPYYVNKAQPNLVFLLRIILWLIPSVPFLESFIKIVDLEIMQVGLQWDKIVFRQKDSPMSFIDNFVIMIFDAILFIGTSIMIEKANTNFNWNTYKKLWEIIKQRFIRIIKHEKKKNINFVEKYNQNNQYMESEPANSKCSLELINWTKETVNGRLLDNVSIKFYENQIICILTDNSTIEGALISVIRKLPHHDLGSIKIYDHIYQNIGYMPTYEIAIEELTVEENLWFYTKLKDPEINIKIKDIERIMKSAQLYDVRYTIVHQLPPKLLRRLCVAIAIVGKSKIVLLQDPFSGLDYYSMHVLCGMLAEYKMGRTIIMTTNDINDAKIVGDKIAIINGGRLISYGSKSFLKVTFTKGFELRIEIDKTKDIIDLARQLRFLNIPEIFETEIHHGLETDGHITSIFLQIMRHFIPNSYFIKKEEQKYIFILPYIMKNGIYDCIGSNLALKKLFCLLDRCRNQWDTLKYEFRTSSLNEVYDNIKLYATSNLANNIDTSFQKELNFATLFKSSTRLNKAPNSAPSAMANNISYSILSSDSTSKHSAIFKQLAHIQTSRFKRNYRNYKFILHLLLIPLLILLLTTFWIRFIRTPVISYPVPLTIMLNNDSEVFIKGFSDDSKDIVSKPILGNEILATIIKASTTFYIKSLGNKCVYRMNYTNDSDRCDIPSQMASNIKSTDRCIGPGYKKIYETIEAMCKDTKGNYLSPISIDIEKEHLTMNKCFCNNKDGNLNCPHKTLVTSPIVSGTSFYLSSIDHISNLPVFFISYLFKRPKLIGGLDRLLKNETYDISVMKQRQNLKIHELLLKVMTNISHLPFNLEATHLNQIQYLGYMSHISTENIKIWFNNRLKIGLSSLLSTYDTAHFRTILISKNTYKHYSALYPYVRNKTKYYHLNHRQNAPTQAINYINIYGGNDYGIISINHPIYSSLMTGTIIYLYLVIFVQICVTSLITTLIIWDMFEDTHNYTHSFQLHNIQPLLQMISHLIYNLGIYTLSTVVCLLIFRINIKYLDKYDHIYNILLNVLYGYALIPFMLTATYLKPKYSMMKLNIINNGIGFLCLLLEFTLKIFGLEKRSMKLALTFLIPQYGFAKASFLLGINKHHYEKRYSQISEFKLEFMDIFWTLISSGIFYYTLVCCYECNIFDKMKQILVKYLKGIKLFNFLKLKFIVFCSEKSQDKAYQLQDNVFKTKLNKNAVENKIVQSEGMEVETSDPSLYPILIKNLTASNLTKINLKVQSGCCMGLFGMDPEMVSLVRLLTGEFIQYQGDIHVMSCNIKKNQMKIANSIGYAPKDIYLNSYLTPRESLEFYAHLKYKSSTYKKVVNFLLKHFEMNENKWIKYCLDSTKRKIILAIALMLNPPILILTDPFKDLNKNDSSIVKKTILDMKSMGICILLISKTIKDYEICSQLSLFADKKIKCFGSLEDLEKRYGGGYVVSIEFNKFRKNNFSKSTVDLLVQRLFGTFTSCQIMEYQISYLEMNIFCPNLHISRIFVTLEAVRNLYDICDYSISLAPFEKILTKFNDSHEDILTDFMIAVKGTCHIPYGPSI